MRITYVGRFRSQLQTCSKQVRSRPRCSGPAWENPFGASNEAVEKAMFAAQTITGRRAAWNKPAVADLGQVAVGMGFQTVVAGRSIWFRRSLSWVQPVALPHVQSNDNRKSPLLITLHINALLYLLVTSPIEMRIRPFMNLAHQNRM